MHIRVITMPAAIPLYMGKPCRPVMMVRADSVVLMMRAVSMAVTVVTMPVMVAGLRRN